MNIVVTGSLGNIAKPLTEELLQKGHSVTVVTRSAEKRSTIEALGAKAAVGTIQDVDFLMATFKDADIVYLMEIWEGLGSIFDKSIDFLAEFKQIGKHYKQAVIASGVNKIIHLSSIGAHTDKGTGSLLAHYEVEQILQTLPENVDIKFMRPVGFFSNIYRWLPMIQSQEAIVQSYGGDKKEPWVSPLDIAATIASEMEKPFEGRTVHYIAGDEVSPNEIARCIGEAIGKPDLEWRVIPADQLLNQMLTAGINEWVAKGMIAMQDAQSSGLLYEDFYQHKPPLGKIKMTDFAREFAKVYHQQEK